MLMTHIPCLIFLIIVTHLIDAQISPNNGPLVYPQWPPTKQQQQKAIFSLTGNSIGLSNNGGPANSGNGIVGPRPQMVFQIRNGPQRFPQISTSASNIFYSKRPSSIQMQPSRQMLRPGIKIQIPHYMSTGSSGKIASHSIQFIKKPSQSLSNSAMTKVTKLKFNSSPAGPHTGEYVFENPFAHLIGSTSPAPLTSAKYSPIHTIPAPNLTNGHQQQSDFGSLNTFLNPPITDNHIYEKEQVPLRPASVHQYQVTEPTNDHINRELFSGKQTYYALDPDTSLPVYKLKSTFDAYSQPPSAKSHQIPFNVHFAKQQTAAASVPVQNAQPYVQLINGVSQQQLPDSYALPLSNQPQLQQHFLQQQSIIQKMPLTAYNPTYLVTQSNQLLNQHKQTQQLFRPEPSYLESPSSAKDSDFMPSYNLQAVASPGQMYSASQDSTDYTNNLETSQSINTPTYAQLVALPPPSKARHNDYGSNVQFPQNQQQQLPASQPLTEQEIANLLNFGKLDGNTGDQQSGFIASSYYQTGQSSTADQQQPSQEQILFDFAQHQKQNEETLNLANQALFSNNNNNNINNDKKIYVTNPPPQSIEEQQQQHIDDATLAHQEHQKRLAEHFGQDLRIYVPDVHDYQHQDVSENYDNFQKRSDDFSTSLNLTTITTTKEATEPISTPRPASSTYSVDLDEKIERINFITPESYDNSRIDSSTELNYITNQQQYDQLENEDQELLLEAADELGGK